MQRIYFLCTGNSCRSQMAEGFAHRYFSPEWQVASAGVEHHGLNPLAVRAMAEVNVDISMQTSKLIDLKYLRSCQLVVTLCGDARDRCPVTPASVLKQHWPLPDPARVTGDLETKMAAFRRVRDEIDQRVLALAQTLNQ